MIFCAFSRPFGTCGLPDVNPAVNCRAILKSPSGRERRPSPLLRRWKTEKFGCWQAVPRHDGYTTGRLIHWLDDARSDVPYHGSSDRE
jgi:hypothetical protein